MLVGKVKVKFFLFPFKGKYDSANSEPNKKFLKEKKKKTNKRKK